MTAVLEVANLSYSYPGSDNPVLKCINFEICEGEVVAIVGLSGCGKSTLCYCLSGIIPHVYGGNMGGTVKILGKETKLMRLPEIATKLGIVFQDPETQLFSPTIEDEIAFGPENLCVSREEIGSRINMSLSMVEMEKYRYSSPNNLSGGQKQLIALASSLSLQPQILIMDEAMAQVDYDGRKLIKESISNLKKSGKTMILVEHDMECLNLADRVLVLKDGILKNYDGTL